jgi:hypothetical protein
MKINFGNYTYFDNNNDGVNIQKGDTSYPFTFIQSHMFDENKFNEMISNRQYSDAADYASQFRFNDPRVQQQLESNIANLRRNGRILGAIYGRIQNPQDLANVEFYDNVFVDGGIDKLPKNTTGDSSLNTAVDDFIAMKSRLGSSENGEATSLTVTFQPKKQTLLGVDWLMPDNDINIDNFYQNSGITEKELTDANVQVLHKDGRTILKFNKSNPMANKILYNLPTGGGNRVGDIPVPDFDMPIRIEGYDDKGNAVGFASRHQVRQIQDLINSTKQTKENYFQELNTEKDYSSTIGPAVDDTLSALQQMYMSGQIDETTFNREYKKNCGIIDAAIASLGSGHYEMYSNSFNENPNDERLSPMDNEQRSYIARMIGSASPKDRHLLTMVSNGKIGTLVVINSENANPKDLGENSDAADMTKTRRFEVFIPGLLAEQAQAKINSNSKTSAIQELNAMQDWGYEYPLADGTKLSADGFGGFKKGDITIDKNQAIREIDKAMIIEQSLSALKFEYLNTAGDMINKDAYEQMARLTALRGAEDMYPGVKLQDGQGNEYTVDDIFNYHTGATEPTKDIKSESQYLVYDKILEIYDIYDRIMQGLTYYNN